MERFCCYWVCSLGCRTGCCEQPRVCQRCLQAGTDVWDVVESKTLACVGLWGVELLNADLSEGGMLGLTTVLHEGKAQSDLPAHERNTPHSWLSSSNSWDFPQFQHPKEFACNMCFALLYDWQHRPIQFISAHPKYWPKYFPGEQLDLWYCSEGFAWWLREKGSLRIKANIRTIKARMRLARIWISQPHCHSGFFQAVSPAEKNGGTCFPGLCLLYLEVFSLLLNTSEVAKSIFKCLI